MRQYIDHMSSPYWTSHSCFFFKYEIHLHFLLLLALCQLILFTQLQRNIYTHYSYTFKFSSQNTLCFHVIQKGVFSAVTLIFHYAHIITQPYNWNVQKVYTLQHNIHIAKTLIIQLLATCSPTVNAGISHNEPNKHKSLGFHTFNFPGPSCPLPLNRILESASCSCAYIRLLVQFIMNWW